METELLVITVFKALTELGGLFLLGRGVLYLLAGAKREQNLFYQLLKVLTRPLIGVARWATPKAVVDRHIPLVAFLILFWLWLLLAFAKIQVCATLEHHCKPVEASSERTRGRAA